MKSRSTQQKRICVIEFMLTVTLCLLLIIEGKLIQTPSFLKYCIFLLLTAPIFIAVLLTFTYHIYTLPRGFRVKETDIAGVSYYTIEVKTFFRGWHEFPIKKVYFNRKLADDHLELINSYYNEKVTMSEQFYQW